MNVQYLTTKQQFQNFYALFHNNCELTTYLCTDACNIHKCLMSLKRYPCKQYHKQNIQFNTSTIYVFILLSILKSKIKICFFYIWHYNCKRQTLWKSAIFMNSFNAMVAMTKKRCTCLYCCIIKVHAAVTIFSSFLPSVSVYHSHDVCACNSYACSCNSEIDRN